eukprot:gene11263-15112_t
MSMKKSLVSDTQISVTDPLKQTDKFGQHFITYKISCLSERAGFTPTGTNVVRRYNDFTWLSGELSKDFPGVIIPPLPEKQAVGRFTSEFVESRRRALERFLQRIAAHHELGSSHHFVTFVEADETELVKAKSEKPKSKLSAMAWLEGTVNTFANSKTELEKSAADIKIEEIGQYLISVEKQISNVAKHSENLVKRNRDLSISMYELGQSFTFLGQSEGDALGSALTQFATTVDGVSTDCSHLALQETVKFLEPLEEYQRMLVSVKAAMQQRLDKKTAYINCISDVEAKQAAYKKLLGVAGKETQARAKEQAIEVAQQQTEQAKIEFEKVSERLLTEFENFKSQKSIDMKDAILSYVSLQVEYNKKTEQAWSELLPRIQSVIINEFSFETASLPTNQPVPYSSNGNSGNQKYYSSSNDESHYHDQDDDELVGV